MPSPPWGGPAEGAWERDRLRRAARERFQVMRAVRDDIPAKDDIPARNGIPVQGARRRTRWVRGQGVMLAPVVYIRELVKRGELVCPFPMRMDSPHGYYMIVNRNSGSQPHVAAFTRWLTEQLRPEDLQDSQQEVAA